MDSRVGASLPDATARVVDRELRAPLSSAIGLLELLGMSSLDRDQRHTFEAVIEHADHMVRSIERLGVLLGLASGGTTPVEQVIDVPELLGGIAADVAADVAIKIDKDVPLSVRGDEHQLRALLAELLDNAVAHAAGPYVLRAAVVATGAEAPELRFSVVDGGTGLPAHEVERLTAEDVVLPARGGIGLYIARLIAQRLSATLEADPPRNYAHAVSVRVPLRAAPVVTAPVAPGDAMRVAAPVDLSAMPGTGPGKEGDAPSAGLRVLLVEDNAVNALLAQRQLAMLGHRLETVTRGREGVEAALGSRFDVILMDRHLPDLDGVQATLQIRARETEAGRPPTPIIAVTADALARNREECLGAGMDGFLTKPVDLDALRAALDEVAAVAAQGSEPGEDVLDLSSLRELAAQLNAPDMVEEIERAFVAELPLRRLRLTAAIRRSSATEICDAAEVLRASCDTVGARLLAAACRKIAAAAAEGNLPRVHQLVPTLRELCQVTSSAINARRPAAAAS